MQHELVSQIQVFKTSVILQYTQPMLNLFAIPPHRCAYCGLQPTLRLFGGSVELKAQEFAGGLG